MMGMLWVVLLVALTGAPFGQGLPLKSTPEAYPHDTRGESLSEAWGSGGGLYAAVPALALLLTAVGLLLGCTWCYRHKDCKPNEGADNQLFSASATHLHDGRRPQPPASEPANNNISEDNNNGPISLREMQNIANNNATAYIVSENEERNRVSRESVVEFEPLPSAIRVVDPLERCADWFGSEDFPRNRLQYLREIGRGWFGRVVEGEIEHNGVTTVAVNILSQNASLEDKARFLDEAKLYRDLSHENVLRYITKCLQEDPWVLIYELCSMDLHQYLINNRPKMAILNESGIPLQLMCDIAAGLAYLHQRGYLYRQVSSSNMLVRDATGANPRGVVGSYAITQPLHEFTAPETRRHPPEYTVNSEIWSLGTLIWEVCTWGALRPDRQPPPPDLPCPYRNHLYQVMQLCWSAEPLSRPSAAQVLALLQHLHGSRRAPTDDFEARWQTLKPNSIPKIDEHRAQIHAPSTSNSTPGPFTDSEDGDSNTNRDTLTVDLAPAVSRSSSIMSEHALSVQMRSESLNNLHGSLDDVRNIYLTHNETATLECHQGNVSFEEAQDRSDSSVDPWVKDLIAGSQDDVSYYRDVSDVIKNLDNILNSEKTSSSESSHQASPSRDNLSLDCKKDYPVQSSMVKSPGITNFKNILEMGFDGDKDDTCGDDDEIDRETIGTLSHSFERHSDTMSQHTLENLTPDTPIKDLDIVSKIDSKVEADYVFDEVKVETAAPLRRDEDTELPKENIDSSDSEFPKKDLCVVSLSSVSENEQLNIKDCVTSCDNLDEILRTQVQPKSIDNTVNDQQKIEEKSIRAEIIEEKQIQKGETAGNNVQINENIEKNNGTEDTILPNITEIATNIIEHEVIHPAIEIVSKIKENEELKCQTSNLNEELPPRLDVRESEEMVIPHHDYVKEATNTQEERKVFEPVEKSVVALSFTEFKIKVPSNETASSLISDHKPEQSLESAHIVEAESSQSNLPEPVQIDNSKTKSVNIETEKAETPTSTVNLHEEELLGFSSNFTDINCEIQMINEQPSELLLPELVQNVNNEVIEKANTSFLVNNSTPFNSIMPDLVKETTNEEIANKIITHNIEVSPIEKEIHKQDVTSESIQSFVEVEVRVANEIKKENFHELDKVKDGDSPKSDKDATNQSNDSTAYMDLINCTNSKTNNSEVPQDDVKKIIQSCLNKSSIETDCSTCIVKNDSTVYLDLPSVLKDTNALLNSERVSHEDNIFASTPKGSECSAENTMEGSLNDNENTNLSETKVAEETTVAKSEQKFIADLLSPFDSPTKSHPTDTYDENSSVVLGPFENCAMEYKGVKAEIDLPKEELLAFSSNFSEINLETPSPLRDGNFLNEVPDIATEDLQFDDRTLSEDKKDPTENTDETDQSATTKHVSPSTPPNSPGVYLASTSQQKYIVDIDLDPPETHSYPPIETDSGLSSLQKEIDLNQIELQITTKLAMAENENNMNIEYSGPLTVEGLVSEDDAILRESDAIPEAFLAGNGGSMEDRSEGISLDEECVKALRNELELKLPLAQVAGIEPADIAAEMGVGGDSDSEWGELPPPPELILHYGAALSPILEETRHQLTQYESDAWNPSTRTESSSSYPEPCNDSTGDVSELPSAARSHTRSPQDRTFTLQKDIPTSRELTMSADSLNGSPFKTPVTKPQSPIDDRTYNKNDDEKVSNCERISQVSPFLTSPTTDTSAPDSVDNATGVSTLSKTTLPTDAKHSKPSECLSKATSIDSWCSNDTLYNVEENFDDLVMEADIPEYEINDLVKSASTDTLTRQDDEKEASPCSTYIVHDSKSERCETFTPDSITANDNYTYTKVKTEATGTTPSVVTKSDANDSTKSQTKDLAYGTLPTYSNCTTEYISGIEDPWKFAQPELVRRSPIGDEVTFTPPRVAEDKEMVLNESPLTADASIKKMDSIDLSCLQDDINSHKSESSESQLLIDIEIPKNYKNNMAPSTSTPLTEPLADDDNFEHVEPMNLPTDSEIHEALMDSIPNFQTFVESAEDRPQDTTFNQDTALLLEGESETLSRNSNKDSTAFDRSSNYSAFENSVAHKPQEVNSVENTVALRPQEVNSVENAVALRPQEVNPVENAVALRSQEVNSVENAVALRPQEVNSVENAVAVRPQEGNSVENAVALRPKEVNSVYNTVALRPQEVNSVENAVALRSQEVNSVENAVALRPQEGNSVENAVALRPQEGYSVENAVALRPKEVNSVENAVALRPQEVNPVENAVALRSQEVNSVENAVTLRTQEVHSVDNSVALIPQELNSVENSFALSPQEVNSIEKSSQNIESEMSSVDFSQFENCVRACPQDLSSLIDASSLFLNNERKSSDLAANSNIVTLNDQTSQSRTPDSIRNIDISPPIIANLVESQHVIPNINFSMYVTDLDEEETDQPHSIIFTEVSPAMRSVTKNKEPTEAVVTDEVKESPNRTFDSHTELNHNTFNSHSPYSTQNNTDDVENNEPKVNGSKDSDDINNFSEQSPKQVSESPKTNKSSEIKTVNEKKDIPNGSLQTAANFTEVVCNGNSQNYATVNFINETFEELAESNGARKLTEEPLTPNAEGPSEFAMEIEAAQTTKLETSQNDADVKKEEMVNGVDEKIAAVTEDFLQNEKKFCTVDAYLPMLSDIRFTGPASEIMSTSFTQDSPTDPESPECEQDGKSDAVADIVKEWDSDTESHSSNSSSGEFIWKDGDGHETPVVTTTHFDHHPFNQHQEGGSGGSRGGSGAGDSGSGSEGDEVEFVPSSWDCRAAPAKSSLRSLEQPAADKKRVVFKRQKYHCVYEYPRELSTVETHSPAYLPDFSTYCEWDPVSAEEAELGYGALYGAPDVYPRGAIGADYDDDFFISSSARPFESLGVMSSASQFFPGMHLKPALPHDDVTDLPPPPSPLVHPRALSLDFTTPDSGVEDITPGSTSTDEDFKTKKLPESEVAPWKPVDSASSSESVSPSSPGDSLGGLRHTRDKLKLDLPPSPHVPSPRHTRVFSFVLDKPRRHDATPLVMTDDTPVLASSLPIHKDDEIPPPEPTFSTFGKCKSTDETTEQKIILTDEESPTTESKEEGVKTETVKGEGTVLDSGDEDSGIESSSKATLERNTNIS